MKHAHLFPFAPSSTLIHYRLYRLRSASGQVIYKIQLSYRGERCQRILPTDDATVARWMYDRIRQGRVTPCTLDDVIEDLAYEMKKAHRLVFDTHQE